MTQAPDNTAKKDDDGGDDDGNAACVTLLPSAAALVSMPGVGGVTVMSGKDFFFFGSTIPSWMAWGKVSFWPVLGCVTCLVTGSYMFFSMASLRDKAWGIEDVEAEGASNPRR